MVEADGVGVERQADVLDAVGAEDVEGDRANVGHHAGLGADAAGVLAQGHIPDVTLRANDNETSSPRKFSLEGAEG